jgi:hypothetical protein
MSRESPPLSPINDREEGNVSLTPQITTEGPDRAHESTPASAHGERTLSSAVKTVMINTDEEKLSRFPASDVRHVTCVTPVTHYQRQALTSAAPSPRGA